MTNTIKVFGYERVSSDGQIMYGNGIQGQQGAIDAYALTQGYDVTHYQDDGVSGSKEHRMGLDAMLADLKKANKDKNNPKIPYVLVDDIDRIARDMKIWINVRDTIESTGAKIISLKQALEDSPEGEFAAYITMAAKVYERANNKRRVRSRQEERLKNGYWCFHLPIGYKYIKNPDGGGKLAVPDEPAFSTISQGLKLFANGTLPTQISLANYLNERGVRTHNGFHISYKFISRMLNESKLLLFYAGFVYYPQWNIEKRKGKHKAAITEEEYYKIVTNYRKREFFKDHTPDDIASKLELRRVIRCGHCGSFMAGSPSRGTGGKYFYYYCYNKKCPYFRKSYNANTIHNEIEEFLGMLTLDERYMDAFKVIVDAIWKEKGEVKEKQVELKEKRIKEIDREIDSAVNKLTETQSDVVYKVLEEKITRLDNEKKQLQAEILSFQSGSIDDYIKEFNSLRAIIQCPLNIRKHADLELKRLLISNIFNNTLSYSKDEGLRTNEIPLIYAQNPNIISKINLNKKSPLRTNDSVVETLHYEKNVPLVEVLGVEPKSKRHAYKLLPP